MGIVSIFLTNPSLTLVYPDMGMPTAFGVLRMHHVISCHFCVATLGDGCFTFSTLQDLVLVRLACLGRVQVGRGWLQLSFGHERVGS